MDDNDLTGWDFTGQNLTDASTAADFANANIKGALLPKGATGFTVAQLYSTANYQTQNLAGVDARGLNLEDAHLTGFNLSDANLDSATLTGASLHGAIIAGASFWNSKGFTAAQLYSTASHQAREMPGVSLLGNNPSGWDFVGQNLSGASFLQSTLTNADLTDAHIAGALFGGTTALGFTAAQLYSTASYQAKDLTGIDLSSNDLTGWDFAGQNLTNASFYSANLTGADLTGAKVTGADFGRTSLKAEQLYSTASYQARGDEASNGAYNVFLQDLTGWDFSNQNLEAADLALTVLVNANFRHANLINANFIGISGDSYPFFSVVYGADLTGADTRGASYGNGIGDRFLFEADPAFNSVVATNTIRPDGRIEGLALSAGDHLVVRDHDGNYLDVWTSIAPIAVYIEQHFIMTDGGELRLLFDADEWNSTISFDSDIQVVLGGTLNLDFAPDIDVQSQLGRTIDLFDWSGVEHTGVFGITSPYVWDLSRLYTTGDITLLAVPEPTRVFLAVLAMVLVGRRCVRMPRNFQRFVASELLLTATITSAVTQAAPVTGPWTNAAGQGNGPIHDADTNSPIVGDLVDDPNTSSNAAQGEMFHSAFPEITLVNSGDRIVFTGTVTLSGMLNRAANDQFSRTQFRFGLFDGDEDDLGWTGFYMSNRHGNFGPIQLAGVIAAKPAGNTSAYLSTTGQNVLLPMQGDGTVASMFHESTYSMSFTVERLPWYVNRVGLTGTLSGSNGFFQTPPVLLSSNQLQHTFDRLGFYVGNLEADRAAFSDLDVTYYPGVPGDYNSNGVVDAADYVLWRRAMTDSSVFLNNEGVSPTTADQADYEFWRSRFGATTPLGSGSGAAANHASVPEPNGVVMLCVILSWLIRNRCRCS